MARTARCEHSRCPSRRLASATRSSGSPPPGSTRSTPRSWPASSGSCCPTSRRSCSATISPGDEVYARPDKDRIGTFAGLIAVSEDDLAPKPAGLTMAQAASLPLVALTAWQALVERANVKPGQKVLIHAGSGGVGTIAIQLAKYLGAYVATTTSTANVEWVRGLGADLVVDYRKQDFEQVVRDYDVVLDSLGGQNLAKSL